jgi:hypothetical protein
MADFALGVIFGAYVVAMAWIWRPKRRKAPQLTQFSLAFQGFSGSLMLVAHKFEKDELWARYLDDRGVELLRLPAAWMINPAASPVTEEQTL